MRKRVYSYYKTFEYVFVNWNDFGEACMYARMPVAREMKGVDRITTWCCVAGKRGTKRENNGQLLQISTDQ